MKTSMLFVFMLFLTCAGMVNSQNVSEISPLEAVVNRVNQAKSPDDWKQCRMQLERLAMAESGDWLPAYYLVYTDIKLFFWTEDKEEKECYLEEAQSYLEKLKKQKEKDPNIRSEINTIQGYMYFAMMALNPSVNGPRYAGLVTGSYAVALKLNPENARAILLNAYFQKSMAAFMNRNYDAFEADIQKACALLEKEDKTTVWPHWGMKEF